MRNIIKYILTISTLTTLTACGGGGGSEGSNLPANNAPVFSSGTTANIIENNATAMSITATDADGDTLTYSLTGGVDQGKFSINSSSGVLSFTSAPDFELPTDSNNDNVYDVQVSVSDGTDSAVQTVSVTVTNVNDASPVITSASTVDVAENTTAVHTVTVTDADSSAFTYSIGGGADQGKFNINLSSGALSFATAPNFEVPTDNNTDNIYEVQVFVSDGLLSASQTINVTVTNVVDEIAPVVSFVSPADGSTSINTNAMIQVVFNEALDCSNVSAGMFNVVITGTSTTVDGTASCSNDTVTYTPTNLTTQNLYTATLTAGIKDVAGNATTVPYQWSFSTDTWTQLLGVTGAGTSVEANAVDGLNNIYITGVTYGSLDGQTYADLGDVYISKYTSNGVKQWTRILGTAQNDYVYAAATDSANNVYVAGLTNGSLNGQANVGNGDLYVAKYNSSGTIQWIQQLGTTSFDRVRAISIDGNDNIYLAGETGGSLDGQTTAGSNDLFIIKYNTSGIKQWTRQLGTAWTDIAYGVTTDSTGNVYVSGWTQDALDGQTAAGNYDLFVTKYNNSGTKQWTRQLGTAGIDKAFAIATDSSDNLYISGATDDNLDGQTISGSYDMFIVKYNNSGVKQWTRLLGTTNVYTQAYSITVDSSDNIYAAGLTIGALDGQTAYGGKDMFVTQFDVNGTRNWTRQLGVVGSDTQALAVSADSSNNIYVSGNTGGNLDGKTKTGFGDAFIVKYFSDGVKQ